MGHQPFQQPHPFLPWEEMESLKYLYEYFELTLVRNMGHALSMWCWWCWSKLQVPKATSPWLLLSRT